MEKVMITIPKELLEDIDSTRKRLNQNRSKFIRHAITEYLKQQKKKEFEELMTRGYMESSEEDSIFVEEIRGIQAIVAEKVWDQDE